MMGMRGCCSIHRSLWLGIFFDSPEKTLPETNMPVTPWKVTKEPKNEGLEDEFSFSTTIPETNMTSPLKIGLPSPKRKFESSSKLPTFRGELAVSFREGI